MCNNQKLIQYCIGAERNSRNEFVATASEILISYWHDPSLITYFLDLQDSCDSIHPDELYKYGILQRNIKMLKQLKQMKMMKKRDYTMIDKVVWVNPKSYKHLLETKSKKSKYFTLLEKIRQYYYDFAIDFENNPDWHKKYFKCVEPDCEYIGVRLEDSKCCDDCKNIGCARHELHLNKLNHIKKCDSCADDEFHKAIEEDRLEDIEQRTCNGCDDIHENDYNLTTCNDCTNSYCDCCVEYYIHELDQPCSSEDCYYCMRGHCFNNRYFKKCIECADDEYIKSVESQRLEEEKLLNHEEWLKTTKEKRKKEMIDALEEFGLALRSDSKLCQKYIEYDSGDLYDIVERMCQMKYLYEYCDMKAELKRVENEHVKTLEAGYIPDCSVFEEAEMNILMRIGGEYPDEWEWLK